MLLYVICLCTRLSTSHTHAFAHCTYGSMLPICHYTCYIHVRLLMLYVFVDLENAFDRVPRKVLELAKKKEEMPEVLA